jgi:signal transduction histidine kinase
MGSLIDDLLDIARMESGQLRLRRRRYDARELLDEAVLGARPLAEEAGVSVAVRCPERAVTLHADWLRGLQIVTNLLSNALKFTPRGGHVEVLLEDEREHALFLVRDTGPGIPAEAQKHLFEPFWQRRRSTGEGAGLGLAIARGLVLAHGGEIGVDSEMGHGSTFWFRLPKGARQPAQPSEGRPLAR